MIKRITFSGAYAKRVGAELSKTIEFKLGVNLLVGPNGSGKSTVFEAIQVKARDIKTGIANKDIKIDISEPISTNYFDFEKHNLRTKGFFEKGSTMLQAASKFKSHGEVNRFLAEKMLGDENVKGSCLLLDEPDQALDMDGVVHLLTWLKSCDAKQAIVAVHHPLLVLQQDMHVIEMRDGFVRDMREHLSRVVDKGPNE